VDSAAHLQDVLRTFRNYKSLGDRAIAQTPDAQLKTELDPNSNSIAVIVKHIAGNLRSRFTDFLTSDGEKPDRRRDTEFDQGDLASREDILKRWNDGWTVVLDAIEALTPEGYEARIDLSITDDWPLAQAFVIISAVEKGKS